MSQRELETLAEELLARVDRLLAEVAAARLELWDKFWAGGLHSDAPPRPQRAQKSPAG